MKARAWSAVSIWSTTERQICRTIEPSDKSFCSNGALLISANKTGQMVGQLARDFRVRVMVKVSNPLT